MTLLQKYNIGVQEFIGVQQMFEKMPEVELKSVEKTESIENMA